MRYAASSDVDSVIKEFNSRTEGHYNEEVTTSRIQYGKNEVTNHNKYVVLKRLARAFGNIFIITLAIIDILWMVLEPDIIYFVILTTLILVSGIVTFIQETRSSKAAAQLVSMVTTIITVRREGVEIEIDSKELVVGDIIILDTGDMVPADVRIIKSNHLKVDQSALTGESGGVTKYADPVHGTEILGCNNMAFMGTNVVGGSAEAIVVAVGDDTIFGSMAEKLTRKKPSTTYDKGTKSIVNVLLRIMYCMVPPVFLIMLIKDYMSYGEFTVDGVLSAVVFALTLAIGLMPEMLATIVSANLAKGSIDMSKKKVIVKDVTAIQNFGAMDVLCSDKTGTLTQNRISVESCNDIYGNPSHSVELLSCLNAHNLKSATNQIDWALDEYAEEDGLLDEVEQYEYVGDVPFDFVRRRATVVVKQDEDVNIMISKGAMPEILSISTGYLDQDRNIQPLDSKTVNDMMGLVEWYSTKGMRVLGITHKYLPSGKTEFTEADECDLIIAGFLVFTDPVKPTAKKAIEDMREYGITVKVLTGDNEYVSRHVCDQIGIPTENILVGPQIDGMSDDELKEVVENTSIFARLSPDNKSRVALALKANGHTVGVMGDGINDVVAMKNADVSISVDTGTDIAKETASMILLEKDLGVLKTGAIEGRKVYVNSIKYVKMIGSINFGYMFSLILGSLFFNFEPMGGIMILIFNLINDFACIFIIWDKVDIRSAPHGRRHGVSRCARGDVRSRIRPVRRHQRVSAGPQRSAHRRLRGAPALRGAVPVPVGHRAVLDAGLGDTHRQDQQAAVLPGLVRQAPGHHHHRGAVRRNPASVQRPPVGGHLRLHGPHRRAPVGPAVDAVHRVRLLLRSPRHQEARAEEVRVLRLLKITYPGETPGQTIIVSSGRGQSTSDVCPSTVDR